MAGAFFRFILWLWPLWLWLLSREFVGSLALGGVYYRSGMTAGPLALYLLGQLLIGRESCHQHSTMLMLSIGSLVSGVIGFVWEYERWHPYFNDPAYTSAFILRNLDFALCLTALLAVVLPLSGVGLRGISALVANRGRKRQALTPGTNIVHGSAEWLPMAAAREVFSPGNLVIGEAYIPSETPSLGGRAPLLHFDGAGHLLTVSGAGGGKTTSVAVPNCLTWKGALVVHDPKAELAAMCARARRSMHGGRRVAILDSRNPESDCMNVLDWLNPESHSVVEDAKALASWLNPGGREKDGNEYFQNEAVRLLQLLILYVVSDAGMSHSPRNLMQVKIMASSPDLAVTLKRIHKSTDLCFGAPSTMAGEFLGILTASPKQWAGIIGHVSEMTGWLNSPNLARLVSGGGSGMQISANDINAGDLDVFVCIPLKTLDSTPGVARLILGALLNARYECGVTNRPVDENILFLIDEMPRLRKMDILETARDAGRGFGITLWAIVQDLGQLEKHYGEDGLTSWKESCMVKTFFGIGDEKTAKMLSEMLGKCTVEYETSSTSKGGSHKMGDFLGTHSGTNTSSQNQTERLLMTPDEIMNMATENRIPNEQLVFLRGSHPLKCGMAKWYRRNEWRGMVDGV